MTQNIDLQEFTRFPIKTVSIADKFFPDILMETPHKGTVTLKLKEEHYPFLFGSVTQTEKHLPEIISEIRKVESEAIDYLVAEWMKFRPN